MARYIVLEYASNEAAEAAVEKYNEATKKGKRVRVVGMFAPPRIYACQCPTTSGSSSALYRKPKAQRGAKYGWWLCGACNKPQFTGHELQNLIPADKILGSDMGSGIGPRFPTSTTHFMPFEWVLSTLSIFVVPTENIKRKKKWRLKS